MNVLDNFGRYSSLCCVSSGGSHLSISSAHCFLWSCRFLQSARSATWMLCPRLSCRCREWKGPFASTAAKREGWPWPCNSWNKMDMGRCSRVHFLEAEKQVQLPVARRFSGKQRGPKFILRHLYPNHPTPSKPQIIYLFVWFAGSSPWPWIHQTTCQWMIAGLSLVPLRCRTQNPFGFWVSQCCGSTSQSMICRSGVSASQSLERARGSGEQCGGWDFCNSDADVRGLLFGLTLLPMFA